MQSTTEGVAGSAFSAAARLSNCCGERLAKFAVRTSVAMFSMAMSTNNEISSGLPRLSFPADGDLAGVPRRVDGTSGRDLTWASRTTIDNAEQFDGVYCIGAPVFDRVGYPVAAVWTTGLMMDLQRKRLPEIGATVRAHADRISARLGFDRGRKPLEVAEREP